MPWMEKLVCLWVMLAAFLRTRRLERRLRTRADILQHQSVLLRRLEQDAHAHTPFYAHTPHMSEWPVLDKAGVHQHFAELNTPGLTPDVIRARLDAGHDHIDAWRIGRSTGTSGNRGYYVLSSRECAMWLGTILAKTIRLRDLLRPHRVALALPIQSTLYSSGVLSRWLHIRFFDLKDGLDAWATDFSAFAPHTVVAPPKVLRWFAESGRLHASNIFSGAEVLDPLDRRIIESQTGQRVRQIYMATEGLLGVACRHGTLHMAEDVVHVEWERPYEASGLCTPVITDLLRRTQIMGRYRMRDMLELDPTPCVCGSPLQAVRHVHGRQDDVLELTHPDGRTTVITPDVLRNAIVDSHPNIVDFRLEQTGVNDWRVSLDPGIDSTVVVAALAAACARMHAPTPRIHVHYGITTPMDRKLRRIYRAPTQP